MDRNIAHENRYQIVENNHIIGVLSDKLEETYRSKVTPLMDKGLTNLLLKDLQDYVRLGRSR